MTSIEHELLFSMLPNGLDEWFDIEKFEKAESYFKIYLLEKNNPPETDGKKIINTIIKRSTIDDFPIRGIKVELIIGRRYWKIQEVEKLLKREINLTHSETKLEKEFAIFLKGAD